MTDISSVWVFNGATARFPSAVFSAKPLAESWIEKNKLSGVLTQYPIDKSVYDWATSEGHFIPSKSEHGYADFIGKFTTASQDHYHYEVGISS